MRPSQSTTQMGTITRTLRRPIGTATVTMVVVIMAIPRQIMRRAPTD